MCRGVAWHKFMMRNFTLLGASIVVGLCLLEFLCRLFVPMPSPYPVPLELIVLDDRGFWTLAPAFRGVMDNGIDFRGKSLTVDDAGTRSVMCRQKNAGVPRVFLVGDSQTFGQGLSDRKPGQATAMPVAGREIFRADIQSRGARREHRFLCASNAAGCSGASRWRPGYRRRDMERSSYVSRKVCDGVGAPGSWEY